MVSPHLWVEYCLYPTNAGGKTRSISLGYSCPCFVEQNAKTSGFDAYPLLSDVVMMPGETRYVGLWFMHPDQAEPKFRQAGKFYLWDGGFVGEATIKPDYSGMTGNERLHEAGLLEHYDQALRNNDRVKMKEIWKRVSPP